MNPPETPPAPTEPANNGNGRRRPKLELIASIAAVAALIVFIYWLHARKYVSTDDAFIDGRIVAVSPRVAGHVESLLVNDNDHVTSGQLLPSLDPRDFQARVDVQQAALEAAQAKARSAEVQLALTQVTSPAGTSSASGCATCISITSAWGC